MNKILFLLPLLLSSCHWWQANQINRCFDVCEPHRGLNSLSCCDMICNCNNGVQIDLSYDKEMLKPEAEK